jgi:hypothetical protein
MPSLRRYDTKGAESEIRRVLGVIVRYLSLNRQPRPFRHFIGRRGRGLRTVDASYERSSSRYASSSQEEIAIDLEMPEGL